MVTSASVGGDTGAYYPPYNFQPNDPSQLIVGTCRVWRGPSAGGGAYSVLSHSFETGGDGICIGNEINLVRSLAAAVDLNGFTHAYAGTDGFGPLVPTTPQGGHVWVSGNVANGPSSWVDQTGAINPSNFPISGIAIDTSYTSAETAYVGIMGFSTPSFPTSHVWQTTDGGSTWIDFSGSPPNALPNAPVNAVVVDPATTGSPGRVYAATDVGVFWSFTAAPNWEELGPAPNSGQAGYLPNVAVTALGIFVSSNSTKLMRASTYGRGVWEFPLTPDFSLSITNTPITIFAGQAPPLFMGAITALGGYSSKVNLSCIPAATCFITPPSVNPPGPPPNGTPLTATVNPGNTPGDYNFDLHGAGTDPNQVTNDATFTLKIVDFNLTAPSPSSITVPPASVSGPVSFSVTGLGSFDDTVNLSCGNLPSGASCNFLPSSSVNPTSANPVAVTLTISTTSSATAGTVPITIIGTVTNGPTKTQNLSLTITLDYSLVISNPSLQAYVNSKASFAGVLTSLNGYNNVVNLSCGAGAPLTCSASPASIVPTSSGVLFSVTAGSAQCGIYNFNIVATGTDSLGTTHLFPVTFTANPYTPPNYTLEVTPASQTAPVNTPTIFNGTLQGTYCYNSVVNVSCGSNHPPSCAVSPASLVPSLSPAPGTPFTVTVSSAVNQTYNFNVAAVGTDPNSIAHSILVAFTSTGSGSGSEFSFTLTPNPGIESLPAGQPAIYDLDLSPTGGTFPSNVALAASNNCPPLSTCAFSTTLVSKGSGDTHVTFTITTTAPVLAARHKTRFLYALWLSLPGLVVVCGGLRRRADQRKQILILCMLALIFLGLCFESACGSGLQGNGTGGNGHPGTPPGTYTMTISATVNSFPAQTAQIQLTVN